VATTSTAPGVRFGIKPDIVKAPLISVLADASGKLAIVIVTETNGVNPDPLTVTVVPTGPCCGDTLTVGDGVGVGVGLGVGSGIW